MHSHLENLTTGLQRKVYCVALVTSAALCSQTTVFAQEKLPATNSEESKEKVLETITVNGHAEIDPNTLPPAYSGGQIGRGTRSGILGNTDIFETPFSSKSFTNELIMAQGARSIDDVIQNDPSIRTSLSPSSILDQSSIRGFLNYTYLYDNLYGFYGYTRVPVQNFERTEIFKGPTATLSGTIGLVGGVINLVPKRATDEPVRAVTVAIRDKSVAGTQLDVGQRFGEKKSFGVRLNAFAESGEEYNGTERYFQAPTLALDYRGDQLRVIFDAGYTHVRGRGIGGNWGLVAGADIPKVPNPRVNPNSYWGYTNLEDTFGLATVEWDFSKTFTGFARYGRFVEKAFRISDDGFTIDSNGKYTSTGSYMDSWRGQTNVGETGIRTQFETGPIVHELAFSVLQTFERGDWGDGGVTPYTSPVQRDIYSKSNAPNAFAGAGYPPISWSGNPTIKTNSVAIADTLSVLENNLRLTLAARTVRIENGDYDKSRTSPTVALLYKATTDVSVYGNYAEALTQGDTAPEEAVNAGKKLDPYVSTQNEIGAKWNRGTYGITAAVFEIRQKFALTDANNVFKVGGEQRNQGIELETFGEVAKGSRLLGGVAWIDAEQKKTEGGATDGKKAVGVPETTANIGGEHDLAAIPGLTLTARVIYTGSCYLDQINTQKVDDWNSVDIGARMKTELAGQSLTVRGGLSNLLDDRHWQAAGRNRLVVAAPRTWQLSATTQF